MLHKFSSKTWTHIVGLSALGMILKALSAGFTLSTTNTSYRVAPGAMATLGYSLNNQTGGVVNPSTLTYIAPANIPVSIAAYSPCLQMTGLANGATCGVVFNFEGPQGASGATQTLGIPSVCQSTTCYAGNQVTVTTAPYTPVYIVNSNSNLALTVIRADSDTVVLTIGFTGTANYIRSSHNGRKVYVTNGGTLIQRYDTTTNVRDFTYNAPAAATTQGVDLSLDDSVLYVGDGANGKIDAFSESSGTLLTSISSGAVADIETAPDGQNLWIMDDSNGSLAVYTANASLTLVATQTALGGSYTGLGHNRLTGLTWFTLNTGNVVRVTPTLSPAKSINNSYSQSITSPQFLGMSPDGSKIYLTTGSLVDIFDAPSYSLVESFSFTSPYDVKVSPVGDVAFVTQGTANTITVLSNQYFTVLTTISSTSLSSPKHLTFAPWFP